MPREFIIISNNPKINNFKAPPPMLNATYQFSYTWGTLGIIVPNNYLVSVFYYI